MLSDKKEKTCICISCFNYYDTRMKQITDFFRAKGYKVVYVTSDFNHFEKKRFKVDYPNTIQVHVPTYKKNISVQRIISQFLFAKRAYEVVKKHQPAIIYCMFPPNSLVKFIGKYKAETGCKLVFDGYDMWPESLPVKSGGKILSLPLGLWANLRDKYIENADLILAVSQAMVDIVKKKWKHTPIKLLKPAISISDLPEYNFDIKDKMSFCYLGNINHITDIELLVTLLGRLAKSKKVELHIIGEGANLNELIAKAKGYGVKCCPHGVVMDQAVKKQIYAQSHFGLNVPREKINSTMSLKSVEYMSVGLPFINSAGGDSWEIVGKDGIGCNVSLSTIDETAKKILGLNKEEMEIMHMNSLNTYKNMFLSQNLDEILSEVINQENNGAK